MDKAELISLHREGHDKLSETIFQLTNQVSALAKKLSKTEHKQASYNSSNEALDKRITKLESRYWKNL